MEPQVGSRLARKDKYLGLDGFTFLDERALTLVLISPKVELTLGKLLEGDLSSLVARRSLHLSPASVLCSSESEGVRIRITFSTEKYVSEVGFYNYTGKRTRIYGARAGSLTLNGINIFSGEFPMSDQDPTSEPSFRVFTKQMQSRIPTKKTFHRKPSTRVEMNTTGGQMALDHSANQGHPSLAKQVSQDISVTSQQSTGSNGQVII